MKRRKTLLTPENQWDRTAAYFMHLNRSEPDPDLTSPKQYREGPPTGVVRAANNCVTFDLYWNAGALFARYEGHFENGRLWLSCGSPHRSAAHGKMPYRFHPFNPDAFQADE